MGMSLPLEGVRILDLSTVGFGPYASQIMAEQGADVIKVEAPEGDSTRYTGPARSHGMAAMYLGLNRNKRSVVLDLTTEAGRAAFRDLVRSADVVMHNIRTQKLAKLGLDYATLKAVKDDIVYAALKGFRDDGPYGGRPAYDDIIQGMCGIADLNDRMIGEPRYVPMFMVDKTCGLFAAQAITAAIAGRARTGRGCTVDVPMFETMVSFVMTEHWYGRHFDPAPDGYGYVRVLAPWRRPFRTADGHICCMPYTDAHWRRLWAERGREDLAADPRFRTMKDRTGNIGVLYESLQGELEKETTAYWLACTERLEIPAGPVTRLQDVEHDPHLNGIGFFKMLDHPSEGPLAMPGVAIRFDGVEPPVGPPPLLGEHTGEILGALQDGRP